MKYKTRLPKQKAVDCFGEEMERSLRAELLALKMKWEEEWAYGHSIILTTKSETTKAIFEEKGQIILSHIADLQRFKGFQEPCSRCKKTLTSILNPKCSDCIMEDSL